MQIQILDSWLREHVNTKATPKQIAEVMSLKSASIERIEKIGSDYLYDIEVTTNRVDMMSVIGLAREAAVALKSEGIEAEFLEKKIPDFKADNKAFEIKIINDPKLCKRVCAAILTVTIGKSPQIVRDRLEASDIRSLNNVIDVTNYVMREIGHPMHVFDADRVGDILKIREGKKGEKIITLDKKEHTLLGGEIVAEDKDGKIIDLLGIMGLENSVVTDHTKRVLLFIDNNDSKKIRDASMSLNIRTDAAVLNEKDVDPELGLTALFRGIQLLQEIAQAKLLGSIFDEYPQKIKPKKVTVSLSKIQSLMGVQIPEKQVTEILTGLGFTVQATKETFTVVPPSYRAHEIEIPEDIIEEVARMYGYHKIPDVLPPVTESDTTNLSQNTFVWEKRVKHALKYWGFTETYTYSLIPEELLEVAPEDAVKLSNPLSTDMVYLRTTLIPSLLQVVRQNKNYEDVKIFELSNVYHKKAGALPDEKLLLSGVVKEKNVDFYEVKGLIQALLLDLGIKKAEFKKRDEGAGATIYIQKGKIGEIEILDKNVIDFELDFEKLSSHATLSKKYIPLPKFPEAVEDLRVIVDPDIEFEKIVSVIKQTSTLVKSVKLLDTYEDKKTFRVTYQSNERNLTGGEIKDTREKVLHALKTHLKAEPA